MIILIHGDDQFRSSLKTQELLTEYKLNNWDIYKFDILDSDNVVDLKELKSVLETQGLFSSSRVILIKNWITKMTRRKKKNEDEDEDTEEEVSDKSELKQIAEMLKDINSQDLVILLYEGKTIGNQKILQGLKFKIEEFPLIKGRVLAKWIEEEALNIGLKIDKSVADVLTVAFEGDTGAILNELKKLSLVGEKISLKEFLDLTRLPNNPIDFELSNAIADKNRKLALKALYKEIEAETIPVMIFGSIISQMRNLLIMKTLEGNSRISLASLGLHPFVIQKTRVLARKFTLEELQKAYKKLFQYDVQTKKGKIDSLLALELFINEFTR